MRRLVSVLFAFLILYYAPVAFGQQEYEYNIKLIKPVSAKQTTFEDQSIKITFFPIGGLNFKLENKTTKTLEIDWQRVSFVDFSGSASRVIHEGVRFIEKDKALPPTIIPPTANITDVVVPVSYISYESNNSVGWKVRDLFEGGYASHAGKTFSLLLPIKIGAITKEYFFTFTVEKQLRAVHPDRVLSTQTLMRKKLKRSSYEGEWLFRVEEGEIACSPSDNSVFFITNGKPYAMNSGAKDKYVDGARAIWNLSEILWHPEKATIAIGIGIRLCKGIQ